MLLKWVFLFILAWYINRTVRNLLRAAAGRKQVAGADPEHEPTVKTNESAARISDDVEDATFEDL